MKKRRIVIASFLLIAILVMGIGFAKVADTLLITGRASYRPATMVAGEVATAIHFDSDFGAKVTTSDDDSADLENIFPTRSASVTGLNAADLTLVINGVDGRTAAYVVTAVYKVVYAGEETLPDVDVATTASIKSGDVPTEGFTINAALYDNEAGTGEKVTTMEPGDEAYAVVTVTYTNPATLPTEVVAGAIVVELNFSTPDAN